MITGASSGIGKAAARTFLKAGHSVYAGARRLEQMKDIEVEGAIVCHLDLTVQESIDAFVKKVLDAEDRIDVLVNNAGYGSYGAVEDVPLEEARRQFEVNVFGLAAMTNAVLPTMRAQRSGRIIHVGSSGGKLWSILGGWYQATKFALEGLSDCTRNELRPFGIEVVLIEPGAIKTEWGDIAIEHIKETSGEGAYKPIAEAAVKFFTGIKSMEADPQIIADAILKGATANKPKTRYAAPGSVKVMLFLRKIMTDKMFDRFFCRYMGIPRNI